MVDILWKLNHVEYRLETHLAFGISSSKDQIGPCILTAQLSSIQNTNSINISRINYGFNVN